MRIITCNLNGIRSAYKKGFFDWIKTQDPDFICLQETKAQLKKLDLPELNLMNYHRFESDAEKPGYSGVAVYTKHKPIYTHHIININNNNNNINTDSEGRFIELAYQDYHIISVYFPSGTSGEHRQKYKYEFMEKFMLFLENIIAHKKSYIICGDINIAHKIIDIKNWRANQKNSGFLPEERIWLDKVFDQLNYIDVFRALNTLPDEYTWWSNRANAYQNNVGWRIDYQIASPDWRHKIKQVQIYKNQRFSDHAPLIVDYF